MFPNIEPIDRKYSVREVILILSRIKVHDMGKQEFLEEIPKKSRELVESLNIDTETLRKN